MMEVVSDIKLEIEEEGDHQENMTSLNNNTELDMEDKEAPLALVKRRPERDITERFPYIDEVTTTTPSRSAQQREKKSFQPCYMLTSTLFINTFLAPSGAQEVPICAVCP